MGAVRGLLCGDLEGHGEEGSGDRHYSPWGPCWEFSRELVYQGFAKALEMGTFLHGALLNIGGGLFTGNSER